MGMFDDITCKYPLPVAGANALDYQTKDTPSQFCDAYEIREDGTLWYQVYDTEDQSEAAKWKAENPDKELPEELKGWKEFIGSGARINKRWEPVADFTGEIRFYTTLPPNYSGWIEWSGYFEGSKMTRLNLIENRNPSVPNTKV